MNNKKVIATIAIITVIIVIGIVLFSTKNKNILHYNDLEYNIPEGIEISNESNDIVMVDSNKNTYHVSFYPRLEDLGDTNPKGADIYNRLLNSTVVQEKEKKKSNDNISVDEIYNLYNNMSTASESKTFKDRYNDIDVVIYNHFKDNKVLYIFKTSINNYCIVEVRDKYENIDRERIGELIKSLYSPN